MRKPTEILSAVFSWRNCFSYDFYSVFCPDFHLGSAGAFYHFLANNHVHFFDGSPIWNESVVSGAAQ